MPLSSELTAYAEYNRHQHVVRDLVENRTVYESHEVELSIYDTFESAEKVKLKADEVLYCGMITGKKTAW
jgi:hypothetical protein